MSIGYSINIGVNKNQYYGKEVFSCVNDAVKMADIAKTQGFEHSVILTSPLDGELKSLVSDKTELATKHNVTKSFTEAANVLNKNSGGLLLITYAGHGGSKPIPNQWKKSYQTWCLYDEELLDIEIYKLIAEFKQNVCIVIISDSCHSGTIVDFLFLGLTKKDLEFLEEKGFDIESFERAVLKAKGLSFLDLSEKENDKLQKNLEVLNQKEIKLIREKNLEIMRKDNLITKVESSLLDILKHDEEIISKDKFQDMFKTFEFQEFTKISKLGFLDKTKTEFTENNLSSPNILFDIIDLTSENLHELPLIEAVKTIPRDLSIKLYQSRIDYYEEIMKNPQGNLNNQNDLQKLEAKVVVFSACGDQEETRSGCRVSDNSVFTAEILKIWNNGKFLQNTENNYQELGKRLVKNLSQYRLMSCKTKEFSIYNQTPQYHYNSTDFLTQSIFSV